MKNNLPIGRALRDARGARSAQECASAAGVATQTWYEIEAGKANPTVATLEKMASAVGRRLTVGLTKK
jgi:transcriptional regulator with XRE-family HTH domain